MTNTNPSQPQIFRVDLFDQNGTPLVVNLNGQTGSSFQDLSVAGGGSVFLSTGITSSNVAPF